MGFLDELEQKAKQQRESEERAAMEREEMEAFFREIAEPTFRELFDYLKRLTEHLNYLGSKREVLYAAPGYGKIKGRMNDDLRVRFGGDGDNRTIDVVGTVVFPRQRPLEVVGRAEIMRLQSFARERGLHTNERMRRDSRDQLVASVFQLAGDVSIRAVISTSVDKPDFQMRFTNVSDFGQLVKVVTEQMDQPLMDKLGRFVAQVDAEFLREDLDETIREELAQKLQIERSRQFSDRDGGREEKRREEQEAREEKERLATARKLSGRFQFRMDEIKKKLSDRD